MYYYTIPSGIVFGGFMYFIGRYAQSARIESPKQEVKSEVQSSDCEKQLTVLANNTFSSNAVTPIVRTFQLNPRCRIVYSTLHRSPLSVHQFLDLSVIQGEAQRARHFHPDTNIEPSKFAITNDNFLKTGAYRHLNLTRGHMAAASNYSSDQALKNSTFSFANVVPQHAYNNSGIWNTFERYCRSLLKQNKCETLQIISGPIFNVSKMTQHNDIYVSQQLTLLKNGIIVPQRLYKIIKCNISNKSYASGFTFANQRTYDNSKALIQFEYPIQEIQTETGLVFNFKQALTGSLSSYDIQGLSKSKLNYDRLFYSALFQKSTTIEDMNNILRRAYQQRINLDQQRLNRSQKIASQASSQYEHLKSDSQASSCLKLSQYLKLHRNLFYLGGDQGRFSDLLLRLEEQAKSQISACRKNATPQEERLISIKISIKDKRYRNPFRGLLSEAFSRQKETSQPLSSIPEKLQAGSSSVEAENSSSL